MTAAVAQAPGALTATRLSAPVGGTHCAEEEYAAFLSTLAINGAYCRQRVAARRRFVVAYPDLTEWFDEPLARRVGRLGGEQRGAISDHASHDARGYLLFLGLRGRPL